MNIQRTLSFLEPGGAPRQNEAGAQIRLEGFVECTKSFPQCSSKLDEILPCLKEAQRGAPVFAQFADPDCLKQAECLWGFHITAQGSPAHRGD